MAKFIAAISFFLISIHVFAEETIEFSSQRKTVLILSSTGGGGHIAASNTLQSLVGNEYDFKIVYPINQLRIWGVPSCEQVYNSMLRNGWIRSMNFIVRNVAPSVFRSYMGKLERIVTSYIETYHPDLVISVIPFVNLPASEGARKAQIPFLIITTDNDLRNWVFEMEKVQHPSFKVTIGADLPSTRDILLKKNVPAAAIETIGLPLRTEFMMQKNRDRLLHELDLPLDKKIILIMMGAAGGDTAYTYAKKVGSLDLNAHIAVIAGRNNKLKRQLERLEGELYSSNTMTVFGFTDRVADLMAVSNVIITKPGPGTINEAIAMKLPILIDNTDISLFWERANVDYVLKYGVGQRIRKLGQLDDLLMAYLYDEQTIKKIKQSFVEVPPNQFHLRIGGIIHELISFKPVWAPISDGIDLYSDGLEATPFDDARISEIFDNGPFSADSGT